jgi:hypothetical protein
MEAQLSCSKFLRRIALWASLLVLPRGAVADDTEIGSRLPFTSRF